LLEILKYRFDALAQANERATVMGVKNEIFDAFSYNQHRRRSPEEEQIHSVAWRLVASKELIDKPSLDLRYGLASCSWTKPIDFSLFALPSLI
jgi:hypothetical protein